MVPPRRLSLALTPSGLRALVGCQADRTRGVRVLSSYEDPIEMSGKDRHGREQTATPGHSILGLLAHSATSPPVDCQGCAHHAPFPVIYQSSCLCPKQRPQTVTVFLMPLKDCPCPLGEVMR